MSCGRYGPDVAAPRDTTAALGEANKAAGTSLHAATRQLQRPSWAAFLDARGTTPEVAAILADVAAATPGEDPRAALRRWMAEDAKVTPLKTLQGLIWRAGYEDGRLKGHLWPDVAPCLHAWAKAGLTVGFSSHDTRIASGKAETAAS